ncbi:MAG TPA: hypothetical protein VGU66_10465 [Candidatus Elarobacter sp.]|nr:hypothetical protein [Candidatus Elarobacter sp.]
MRTKTRKRITPKQIATLASKFGVDVRIVEQALQARGGTKHQKYNRLNRVQNDFYKMFWSDRSMMHGWINAPNEALGNRSPAEFVAEGRVDVLERARDVMKNLQFA